MTITIHPEKVTSVLLPYPQGWMDVTPGSLTFDQLDPTAPITQSGPGTFGFSCVVNDTTIVKGRLSAILAVQETE